MFIHLIISITMSFIISIYGNVVCRDPALGYRSGVERGYVIVSRPEKGGGLGNYFVFFPAAYFYAVLSGRDIIIHDKGVIGEFCSVVVCGFPFLSQMVAAYPESLTDDVLSKGRGMKANDMMQQYKGSTVVDNVVVYPMGSQWKSDWYLWMNGTTECIEKVTGCAHGDYNCAHYYALQALIKGPFRAVISVKEEERINGIPAHIRHGILTLPHAFAPKIPLSVHMRAQFKHFESQTHYNSSEYKEEVSAFLNSTHGQRVFDLLEEKLVLELTKLEIYNTSSNHTYVYVAADNEDVKNAFISRIEGKHHLKVMRVETTGIVHFKDLSMLHKITGGDAIFDAAFDWYALSLSSRVLAYRAGFLKSTFAESAVGNSFNATIYSLLTSKRGHLHWA